MKHVIDTEERHVYIVGTVQYCTEYTHYPECCLSPALTLLVVLFSVKRFRHIQAAALY
jgi:hypothetical protein